MIPQTPDQWAAFALGLIIGRVLMEILKCVAVHLISRRYKDKP